MHSGRGKSCRRNQTTLHSLHHLYCVVLVSAKPVVVCWFVIRSQRITLCCNSRELCCSTRLFNKRTCEISGAGGFEEWSFRRVNGQEL